HGAVLAPALRGALADWPFRGPTGGLSLWCELPGPGRGLGIALADEAERHGVIIAPGPVIAPDGGLDRFVRIPSPRGVDELERAVAGIAEAWAVVSARQSTGSRSS